MIYHSENITKNSEFAKNCKDFTPFLYNILNLQHSNKLQKNLVTRKVK